MEQVKMLWSDHLSRKDVANNSGRVKTRLDKYMNANDGLIYEVKFRIGTVKCTKHLLTASLVLSIPLSIWAHSQLPATYIPILSIYLPIYLSTRHLFLHPSFHPSTCRHAGENMDIHRCTNNDKRIIRISTQNAAPLWVAERREGRGCRLEGEQGGGGGGDWKGEAGKVMERKGWWSVECIAHLFSLNVLVFMCLCYVLLFSCLCWRCLGLSVLSLSWVEWVSKV